MKVSSTNRSVTARERARTEVTEVTAHIARSYMSSARQLSEGSSSEGESHRGQSQFVIPSARELSEDEANASQHRLPFASQLRQAGIEGESMVASEEEEESELDEEEEEDEITSEKSSEIGSSCSNSNEELENEVESEQGTGSFLSDGGVSSLTSASQSNGTFRNIFGSFRNLNSENSFHNDFGMQDQVPRLFWNIL